MKIRRAQYDTLGRARFTARLDAKFAQDVQEFGALNDHERLEFLDACINAAYALGIRTEQGVASYALGAWWIELSFERRSQVLADLLIGQLPEVRKISAMNEWIHTFIGSQNVAAADDKLLDTLSRSQGWGT